jgi:hypoxanthine phosphoribosyltransferase
MAKKESTKRGYMTPEDVRKHLKGDSGEDYRRLKKIFYRGRRGLLSKRTKDSIKQVIGEIAIDRYFRGGHVSYIKEDTAHRILDEFANQVKFFHDVYKPDYVFLTETSSTPIGYILKEAWKTAYPDEKPPVFLRIIPGRGDKEFFEKRIKDKDSKIFVYDEFVETRGTLKSVGSSLKRAGYKNIMLGTGDSRDGGIHLWYNARYGDKPDFSTPGYYFMFEMKRKQEEAETKEESDKIHEERGRAYKILKKAHFGQSPRLTDFLGKVTYKGSPRREAKSWDLIEGSVGRIQGSTATIHAYKAMGKFVGEYILEEEQKEDSQEREGGLEKKVLTVSVVSLIVSAFLLSSNITGNAIADLSTNTTSWVGGVLLVVGLVAGFFWIKSKKKNPVVKKKK